MEWKMDWNSERTQLQLTCVIGTPQSSLNQLVCYYLTTEAFMNKYSVADKLLYPSMALQLAHHQVYCYCSLAKPDLAPKATVQFCDTSCYPGSFEMSS